MAKEEPKLKCVPGECCSEPLYAVKPSEPISTWDELLSFYKNCEPSLWGNRWIFRAQEDSTWCLTSSLERAIYRQHGYFLKDGRRSLEDARKWEKRLLRQFQRIAPMFLSQPPDKTNWMEWLALLRHHGGPTRLLDWTYSFWIAIFLAIAKAKDGNNCAIWALNVDWWKEHVEERTPKLSEILHKDGSNSEAELDFIFRLKGKRGVWPVNAFRLNKRLQAQQGLFLMPLDATRGFMENLSSLDRNNEGPKNLFKIVIACDKPLRAHWLTELQRMNISFQTLFPGLGGLAIDLENQMLMEHLFKGIGDESDD